MSVSVAGVGGASSSMMVSGASPYSSPTTKMTNLFNSIDTNGTGSISQQQFNQAFSTMNPPGRFQSLGASAIFSKLDPQGTGSVTKSDFVNGMTALTSSFSNAGSVNGASTAATVSPAQSLSQSQQSLDVLGQSITANSPPGSVVNELV